MLAAPKQEVLQYLDQMDESNITRVLFYVKSLSAQQKSPKSPYGKFATADEYARAQQLWTEFEDLCQPSIIPDAYDYKKAANDARQKKYESLS